jgi:hypothetical protein
VPLLLHEWTVDLYSLMFDKVFTVLFDILYHANLIKFMCPRPYEVMK